MNRKDLIDRLINSAVSSAPTGELRALLESGRPLRVKAGFDPTAPDLHFGHAVLLMALRRFQDLGHTVILLIGDFTAQIGDPTGKSATRPPLTKEQVAVNAATYQAQAFTVLDPARTEVRFNSEWLASISASDLIKLASQQTVARMLDRADFSARYSAQTPIAIHEFLYPLLQAQDSLILGSDIEVGGSDQLFNLLMGRTIQSAAGAAPQVVLTMPLLEGLDGVKKMSKSLGNHIAVTEEPISMVNKIMVIKDAATWRWLDLLSQEPASTIAAWKSDVEHGTLHPRDAKLRLAREMVGRFHGPASATSAISAWESAVRGHGPTPSLPVKELEVPPEGLSLPALLAGTGLTSNRAEARRKIKEGAVRLDGAVITEVGRMFLPGFEGFVQIGKRCFVSVKLMAAVHNAAPLTAPVRSHIRI
jgi:tyrosyl-tRNA synthetase